MPNKLSKINTIETDILQNLIDTSSTLREVLRKLGMNDKGGGNAITLNERIKKDNISLDKLNSAKKLYTSNIAKSQTRNPIPLSKILHENSSYSRSYLKTRLLNESLLENKCYLCGQPPFHNGKQLILQLDHINGINNDNRIENLRVLCPNCHTQTHTYCRKK